jgi:hypothetical protein
LDIPVDLCGCIGIHKAHVNAEDAGVLLDENIACTDKCETVTVTVTVTANSDCRAKETYSYRNVLHGG